MANTFSQESKLSRFELAKMTVNPYKLGLEKECGFQGKSLCIRKPTHCERVLSGSKKNIESWDDISRCDMPSREVLRRLIVVLYSMIGMISQLSPGEIQVKYLPGLT